MQWINIQRRSLAQRSSFREHQAALEALRRFNAQGFGTLINLGSVASKVPIAYQSSYCASKAAILSLSRSLNEELRLADKDRIKVGTIMPWAADTPFWEHAANYSGHMPDMAAMDNPDIVVDAIVRACTDAEEEQPVGWKAKAADASHYLFADLTERMSANTAHRELEKSLPVPPSTGSLYNPVAGGTTVHGINKARTSGESVRH
jgi:short-subunit dehydrogenase